MGIEIKRIKSNSIAADPSTKNQRKTILDLNKDIDLSFARSMFSDKKKESFFSELGILISSGLDISSAFQVIIEQEVKESERQIIQQIYDDILKGVPVNEAVANSGKFTEYDYFCIGIGEESGQLSIVLNQLSSFYTRKIKYKRKIVSALTYPLLVLFTALVTVVFMLNFLVPMFVDVFNRTNSELPGLTKFIINLSNVVSEKLFFFILIITAVMVLLYINRKKESFRKQSSHLVLHLPVIGPIIKLVYLERFIIAMLLLTKTKVSILKSISLIKKMISFYPLEKAMSTIEDNVIHGKLLHESMSAFSIFDKKIVSLIKIGEEVNQLDLIFEKLNKQYSEDLEYKINNITSFLEPVLIIFVGLVVGVILISMYLPIFQIGNTIVY